MAKREILIDLTSSHEPVTAEDVEEIIEIANDFADEDDIFSGEFVLNSGKHGTWRFKNKTH